jgi:hypothetical protein
MKTLDEQYIEARARYEAAKAKHAKGRSIEAAIAQREMRELTARILRRDNRRRKAA